MELGNARGNIFLKLLDKYTGTAILYSLGNWKKKRALPGNIESIALLKTAGIGDTVLLTAVIEDIRTRYPKSKLVLFTGESNYDFARGIKDLDEVVLLPIKNPMKSIGIIRKYHFHVFFDYGPWPRLNAILSFFSHSDFTVGFHTEGQNRHYAYDQTVAHLQTVHELENYRNIIRAVGIEPNSMPYVNVQERILTPEIGSDYIVIHPWPGGIKSYLKEWPLERWTELADRFTRLGFTTVITGGPKDRDKAEALRKTVSPDGKTFNLAGIPLPDTVALLRGARLLVSVNTGIMHIAAALNLPLVALHGPTSTRRWGPLSKKAISIVSKMPGCGYLHLGFEYPGNPPDCMGAIAVEEVFDAAMQLINRVQ